ncbi:hypothetical protein Taro_052283 [Colocasia esculenta]|uniref:Histone chaperone ASF1A n=1 Tax=Colocasia esculenta TaxID=4460 RepID=A0A843XJ91_COLES|nr:hypothetical protein [Colocasia esculenta]
MFNTRASTYEKVSCDFDTCSELEVVAGARGGAGWVAYARGGWLEIAITDAVRHCQNSQGGIHIAARVARGRLHQCCNSAAYSGESPLNGDQKVRVGRLTPLDLEWKLIYVGSAEDETYDQLLESVLVGPVNVGNYRFVLQADPPDPSKIPDEDIIGVTVLLLTCSYLGQEFIRVGYYVNNDYDDEQLREEPPPRVLIDRVQRNILADKPRVTKFPINFHPETNENGGQPPPQQTLPDDTPNEESPHEHVPDPSQKL